MYARSQGAVGSGKGFNRSRFPFVFARLNRFDFAKGSGQRSRLLGKAACDPVTGELYLFDSQRYGQEAAGFHIERRRKNSKIHFNTKSRR